MLLLAHYRRLCLDSVALALQLQLGASASVMARRGRIKPREAAVAPEVVVWSTERGRAQYVPALWLMKMEKANIASTF